MHNVFNKPIGYTSYTIAISITALAAYGFEAFNFQFSLDEELWAYNVNQYKQSLWWIGIGRWSLYLLCLIFPNPTIPVIPTLIGLAMYSYGTFLMLTSINERFTAREAVFGMIMLAYPTLYHIFSFSTCYGVGAGVLAIGVGSRFLTINRGKLSLIISSACFAFAIGSYQSLITIIPMWSILWILTRIINQRTLPKPEDWRLLVRTAYAMVIGLVIYGLVWLLLLTLTNTKVEYIDGLWHPEILYKDFDKVFLSTIRNAYSTYIDGSNELYAGGARFTLLMVISSATTFLFFLSSRGLGIYTVTTSIALLIAFMGIPFIFNLTNGGWVPIRTYMALPLAFAGISYVGFLSSGRWRGAIATISVLSVLELCIITVRLENTMQIALRNDMALGDQIIHEINKVTYNKYNKPKYIDFVGQYSFPSNRLMNRVEMVGPSFFEWDGGNNDRIVPFLLTLGMPYLLPLDRSHREAILKYVDSLPNWPAEGSIAVLNDVVIVKLGDYSSQQRIRMGTYQ